MQEELEAERELEYDENMLTAEDVVSKHTRWARTLLSTRTFIIFHFLLQVPGETSDAEAGMAGKKSVESIKSTESIIEAVEIRRHRLAERAEGEQVSKILRLMICKAWKYFLEIRCLQPTPHPLVTALGSKNMNYFIVDVLQKVRSR